MWAKNLIAADKKVAQKRKEHGLIRKNDAQALRKSGSSNFEIAQHFDITERQVRNYFK